MTVELLSLKSVQSDRAAHICADALLKGSLVVFPTETVYGIGALASNADAVSRLCFQKERHKGHALPLAVSSFDMAKEYVLDLPSTYERLARRFWPGPLTLVVKADKFHGKFKSFSKESIESIMPQSSCGFRVPQNDFLLNVIRLINAPIVLTSANISGKPPATTVLEAFEALGNKVNLFVDGGPAILGKASTVAQIAGNDITILREGSIGMDLLQSSALKSFLFICTTNLILSPIAKELAAKTLADYLNIPFHEVRYRYRFFSAGTDASLNHELNPLVQKVLFHDYNISIDKHLSRRIDESLLRNSDLIFTMEESQRKIISEAFPTHSNRIFTLSAQGKSIRMPNKDNYDAYRSCARIISSSLQERLQFMIAD